MADGCGLLMNCAEERAFGRIAALFGGPAARLVRNLSDDELEAVRGAKLTNAEMSYMQLWDNLNSALRNTRSSAYIVDIYQTYFIFQDGSRMYKQSFKMKNERVTLDGDALEVRRVVEYRDPKNLNTNTEGDSDMATATKEKKKVANRAAEESDDETEAEKTETEITNTGNKMNCTCKATNGAGGKDAASGKDSAAPDVPKKRTLKDILNEAPPEIATVLKQGLRTLNQKRVTLIKGILANAGDVYSEDELKEMEIENLEKIHSLASKSRRTANEDDIANFGDFEDGSSEGDFSGLGDARSVKVNIEGELPEPPIWNFRDRGNKAKKSDLVAAAADD